MPAHIPGFFFDPVKKKYFKIQKAGASTPSALQYTPTAIHKRKREEQIQSNKKFRCENKTRNSLSQLLIEQKISGTFNCIQFAASKLEKLEFKSIIARFSSRIADLSQSSTFISTAMDNGQILLHSLLNNSTEVVQGYSSEATSTSLKASSQQHLVLASTALDGNARVHVIVNQPTEIFSVKLKFVSLWTSAISSDCESVSFGGSNGINYICSTANSAWVSRTIPSKSDVLTQCMDGALLWMVF